MKNKSKKFKSPVWLSPSLYGIYTNLPTRRDFADDPAGYARRNGLELEIEVYKENQETFYRDGSSDCFMPSDALVTRVRFGIDKSILFDIHHVNGNSFIHFIVFHTVLLFGNSVVPSFDSQATFRLLSYLVDMVSPVLLNPFQDIPHIVPWHLAGRGAKSQLGLIHASLVLARVPFASLHKLNYPGKSIVIGHNKIEITDEDGFCLIFTDLRGSHGLSLLVELRLSEGAFLPPNCQFNMFPALVSVMSKLNGFCYPVPEDEGRGGEMVDMARTIAIALALNPVEGDALLAAQLEAISLEPSQTELKEAVEVERLRLKPVPFRSVFAPEFFMKNDPGLADAPDWPINPMIINIYKLANSIRL